MAKQKHLANGAPTWAYLWTRCIADSGLGLLKKRLLNQLELMPDGDLIPLSQQVLKAPSVSDMLYAVVQKGITTENVSAIEKLVGLYERMQEKDAEKQFAQAFVALQGETLKVNATKAVPGNDGSTRYKFAPFEEIMDAVGPKLKEHGFTVTFSSDYQDGRIIMSCTLQHVSGHSRTNKFAVRVGSGPPKASEAQADGAANTYAKRFALCNALNIRISVDTDARAEGEQITQEQANDLRRRVRDTASDEEYFLKFARAETFESIKTGMYAALDSALRRKESTR